MLTKRPENATKMLPLDWLIHPRPHVWFGVSVENQQYWERRVSLLMEIPAAIRWVSYEPALGPLASLEHMRIPGNYPDWLVIGGESSQDFPARSFDIAWAEGAIALCREHGVAPFMKQIGSNAYHGLLPFRTKDRAGADPAEWPESIRVREFPLAFPHAQPGEMGYGLRY
jgi:protein gp37